MKVLMFGWEFPPFHSGGLGTACYGLTKALDKLGVKIAFVLPSFFDSVEVGNFKILATNNLRVKRVSSPLYAYVNPSTYANFPPGHHLWQHLFRRNNDSLYGENLFEEIERYTKEASIIAIQEDHDVIHAHDWLTYPAGIEAKKASGKPLLVHVHSTEFDRTGGNGVNERVYHIEKYGLEFADKIIAVSNYTKNMIIKHYNINPGKIEVVYNGTDFGNLNYEYQELPIKKYYKLVLFLGRITLQKGPDYFLYAAKMVSDVDDSVRFVYVGSGDMEPFILEKSAELGISDKIIFAGFLRGNSVDQVYKSADVYVLPSVSDPFGITPLEAMKNNVPCIISKTSGVSEVINHCLKVDFWDVHQLASKILSVLKYPGLYSELRNNGFIEVQKLSWKEPAKKCFDIYRSVANG